jgi:hypothetical protein
MNRQESPLKFVVIGMGKGRDLCYFSTINFSFGLLR